MSANKYGAKRVEEDGYSFASLAEHRRYRELKLMISAGAITELRVHPTYPLIVNGMTIGRYTPDFLYRDVEAGKIVVEDVKGGAATSTEAFRLRKRLVKALYGIDVTEVAA